MLLDQVIKNYTHHIPSLAEIKYIIQVSPPLITEQSVILFVYA